jgi:DNA-binding transcriptional MerR regulator
MLLPWLAYTHDVEYNPKAASAATGVSASTLRSWERRYGLPAPKRSKSGRRLYADTDIAVIQRMASLLETGMAASQAAKAIQNAEPYSIVADPLRHTTLLLTLSKVASLFPNGSINIFDRDFRYVFAEGLGLAAIGLSSHDLVGRTIDELFPSDQVAAVAAHYRAAFDGESVQFELEVAGHRYLIAAGPLDVEDGVVQTIIAVAQDLTPGNVVLAARQPTSG